MCYLGPYSAMKFKQYMGIRFRDNSHLHVKNTQVLIADRVSTLHQFKE
jgi:hypothetical protein